MKKIVLFFLIMALILIPMSACTESAVDSGTVTDDISEADVGENQDEEEIVNEPNLNVKVKFAVFSDTHIKNTTSPEYSRLINGFQTAGNMYDTLDAICLVGDYVDSGTESQYKIFTQIVEDNLKDGTEFIVTMGNHESYSADLYKKYIHDDIDRNVVISGYNFISVGIRSDNTYTKKSDYLKEQLEIAAERDQDAPIFVFIHYPVYGTIWGSVEWGDATFYDILKEYPQVIHFSGHTHYPMNDPKIIHQKDFTSIGTSTFSYYEIDSPQMIYGVYPPDSQEAGQMLFVEIDEHNTVTIRRYDMVSGEFISYPFVIESPGDKSKFRYTDDRYNTSSPPSFENPQITINNIRSNRVSLTFSQAQATDDDTLAYYKILVKRVSDGKAVLNFNMWAESYKIPLPETLSQEIIALSSDTEYELSIIAVNSFDKESEPITEKFTTAKSDISSVSVTKPDFINIRFENGEIFDNSPNSYAIQKKGNPKIETDPELNAEVGVFDGRNSGYKIPMTDADYKKVTKSFTIECYFSAEDFLYDYNDPFSGMQSGSFGFDASNGEMFIWANINGSYKYTGYKIEKNKYYHFIGTYDGEILSLYVDGELEGVVFAKGSVTFTTSKNAKFFAVGMDADSTGNGEFFFKGKVALANIYTQAMSETDVTARYNSVKNGNLHED